MARTKRSGKRTKPAPTFVLDKSITMAWIFEDETDAYAEAVLRRLATHRAIVPSLWPLEVINALIVDERRKRIAEAKISRWIRVLTGLPIDIDDETNTRAWNETLNLRGAINCPLTTRRILSWRSAATCPWHRSTRNCGKPPMPSAQLFSRPLDRNPCPNRSDVLASNLMPISYTERTLMIDLDNDIHSLSSFKRNTPEFLRSSRKPAGLLCSRSMARRNSSCRIRRRIRSSWMWPRSWKPSMPLKKASLRSAAVKVGRWMRFSTNLRKNFWPSRAHDLSCHSSTARRARHSRDRAVDPRSSSILSGGLAMGSRHPDENRHAQNPTQALPHRSGFQSIRRRGANSSLRKAAKEISHPVYDPGRNGLCLDGSSFLAAKLGRARRR